MAENRWSSRRDFLRTLRGFVASLPVMHFWTPAVLAQQKSDATVSGQAQAKTIIAYVDTLVPADEQSPGAVDLGVHKAMITDRWLAHKTVRAGCAWMDKEAQREFGTVFSVLTIEKRSKIVAKAEQAPWGSPPRRLFISIRKQTMLRYYAHPKSWAPLGLDGPPQPNGYMDYADPWKSANSND